MAVAPERVERKWNRRWFPWISVGLLVASAMPAAWLASWLVSLKLRPAPPPCYGLGLTCNLDGTATALAVGTTWFLGALCVGALTAVSEVAGQRLTIARSTFALVFLLVPVFGTALLLLLWLVEVF